MKFLIHRLVRVAALAAVIGANSTAEAAKVLVFSSENYDQDQKLVAVLTDSGHTVTLGPSFTNFDLSTDLRGYETVILQVNYNYNSKDMPARAETYLRNFVQSGGGLVTMGWLGYVQYYSRFLTLGQVLPFTARYAWRSDANITYTADTADAVLNAGLPASFTFPAQNISGTEELMTLKPGAVRYYGSDNAVNIGVVGWTAGNGKVVSFAAMGGLASLNNANFATLMANAAAKVAGTPDEAQLYKGLESALAPKVNIRKKKITTSKSKYRLKGTASGYFRIQRVQVQIGRKSTTALGTSSWAKNIRLAAKKTKCTVRAIDANGFVSAPVKVVIKRKD